MRLHVKLKALVLVAVLALGGGLLIHSVSAASVGTMYITPSSSSVQVGSNVTVSVRLNPGTAVNAAQFTLNFDSAKLQYVSSSTSGSPFSVSVPSTTTASSVSISSASFSGDVSTDSLVATVTLKALAGSGSSSLTLSGANAGTSGGTYTNPGTTGGTVSFTSPACPAGQTGTYPNCVTPTPPSGGGSTGTGTGSTGSTSGGSKTGTTTTTTTKSGTTSTTTTTPTTTATTTAAAPTVTNVAPDPAKLQFTQATISFSTSKPTEAYIKYGLDQKLSISTPVSALATSHNISLDPTLLIPGTTYYYEAVATDQQGNQTVTPLQTLTTKGYTLHVTVLGKDGKPLKNASIVLHSTPTTAKTDSSGVVTFSNVTPGAHHVVYVNGSKQYTQPITVDNTVSTDKTSGAQTAPVQNLSVQLNVTSHTTPIIPVVVILLLAVLVAAFVLFRDRFTGKFNKPAGQAPGATSPVVVSSDNTPAADPIITPGQSTAPQAPSMTDRLNKLPDPDNPNPGTLIRPQDDNLPKE